MSENSEGVSRPENLQVKLNVVQFFDLRYLSVFLGGKLWFQMPWQCWELGAMLALWLMESVESISRHIQLLFSDTCAPRLSSILCLQDDGYATAGDCKRLRYHLFFALHHLVVGWRVGFGPPNQADMAAYQILKPLFFEDLPLPWEVRKLFEDAKDIQVASLT